MEETQRINVLSKQSRPETAQASLLSIKESNKHNHSQSKEWISQHSSK